MTTKEIPPPPRGSDKNQLGWADDSLARKEEKLWPKEGSLRGQERRNQLWFLKTLGFIIPCLMVIFFLIFASSLIAWAIHQLVPECWTWMSERQLSNVQSVIFSGTLGAIVSAYANHKLSQQF